MSRVLPILFNTEMVRAILDGRKTVTRRLVKNLEIEENNGLVSLYEKNEDDAFCISPMEYAKKEMVGYCQFRPGDVLYVRETFVQAAAHIFWYKADNNDFLSKCKAWKPSIHMPKEAARIFLKVKDVRVERLQDITEDGAVSEGVYPSNCRECTSKMGCDTCPDEGYDEIDSFVEIWNSTIKKSDLARYGWNANPWVWVIEFERCEKPEEVNHERDIV